MPEFSMILLMSHISLKDNFTISGGEFAIAFILKISGIRIKKLHKIYLHNFF